LVFRSTNLIDDIIKFISTIKQENDKVKFMLKNEVNLSGFDLHLFAEGNHCNLFEQLGAHYQPQASRFSVWAPNATYVSVIGDFNGWNRSATPLASLDSTGIWTGRLAGDLKGQRYKFFIKSKFHNYEVEKADPFARFAETRPNTASIIWHDQFQWEDTQWIKQREEQDFSNKPISIYEIHLGSWKWNVEQGRPMSYRELAAVLPEYLKQTGFTHVQLMPITEFPYDPSWGYQVTGYFAPTSRYGAPEDLKYLINELHKNQIGVLLDWVPAHFPKDEHGLGLFDGTHLFEHQDPRKGEHPDWGTLIFNYSRNEVRSFLLSSAHFWIKEFHFDGLRLDAVASMLYLDYSRKQGEWIPNQHGGNENEEAIHFLKELNTKIHQHHPGAIVIAEESTAFPKITHPVQEGGLGFDMKWDMGWMNDSLIYFKKDPIYRKHHHFEITFRMDYAYKENYCLSLSHDEVVHGKQSLVNKMSGDRWQQFANLRVLYTHMFAMPGKKLLFMGNEFAQSGEWDFSKSLDWHLLEYSEHHQIQKLITDLNRLYQDEKVLHEGEFSRERFFHGDFSDNERSTLSFFRKSLDSQDFMLFVFNFTPTHYPEFHVGVPREGRWEEVFNSDSQFYGGSNQGNQGQIQTKNRPMQEHQNSLIINLPPLAGVFFKFSHKDL
jgi:1,4-alpha-glucan branching enzyme